MIAFSNDNMSEPLAYIVENDIILGAIMQQLRSAPNPVDIRFQTAAKAFTIPGKTEPRETTDKHPWVKVELQNGEHIYTQLLVSVSGFLFVYVLFF